MGGQGGKVELGRRRRDEAAVTRQSKVNQSKDR